MFEIDYLWVGEGEKTGDTISARFTNPATQDNVVIVIDGGFTETGARMVTHIRNACATDTVDLAVCTHPDDDHIRGLFTVLEDLTVKRLLIHRPSNYGYTAKDDVKADLVDDLIATATSRGTIVDHYYAATRYFGGALAVAGPTEAYYKQLLAEQASYNTTLAKVSRALGDTKTAFAHAIRSLFSDPGETMTSDNGGTTPRNNTSIVIDLQVEGQRALFTGDAGVPALTAAADTLDRLERSAAKITIFDVPHHGSRHNVDPEILNRLLGHKGSENLGCAIASVGKTAHDHPRPEVANAIHRRGYPVYRTAGNHLTWQGKNTPTRPGRPADPMPWQEEG